MKVICTYGLLCNRGRGSCPHAVPHAPRAKSSLFKTHPEGGGNEFGGRERKTGLMEYYMRGSVCHKFSCAHAQADLDMPNIYCIPIDEDGKHD